MFDQMVSFGGNTLTYKTVIENLHVLDYDYYFKIADALNTQDTSTALLVFNEIIWKSVKGAASPMPAPVRAAFVMPRHGKEKERDDDGTRVRIERDWEADSRCNRYRAVLHQHSTKQIFLRP